MPSSTSSSAPGMSSAVRSPPLRVTSGSTSPWMTSVGTSSAAQAVGRGCPRRRWRAAAGPTPCRVERSGRRPPPPAGAATGLVEVRRGRRSPATRRRRPRWPRRDRSAGGLQEHRHGLRRGLPDVGVAGGRHDRRQRAHPRAGARSPSSGRSSRPSTRRPRGPTSIPRWSSSAMRVGRHVGQAVGRLDRLALEGLHERGRGSRRRGRRPSWSTGRRRGCRSGSRRTRGRRRPRTARSSQAISCAPRPITSSSGSSSGSPKVS